MLKANINDVNADDINRLISDQVAEQRTLDYKGRLPSRDESEKAEFCKDVSSFANTVGGYILFGLAEATDDITKKGLGYPDPKNVGLRDSNLHERIHDLEQILLRGIDPVIPNIEFRIIENVGDVSAPILALKIPNSWLKPHMVTSNKVRPFWMRHSKGAFDLSASQIRNEFLASERITDQIRAFIRDRHMAVLADEGPIMTGDHSAIIVHVIPLQAFATDATLDSEGMYSVAGTILPISGSGMEHFYNFEGFVLRGERSYLQVFRNGAIETVNTEMLKRTFEDEPGHIPTRVVEGQLTRFVTNTMKFYGKCGVQPPYFVSLSMTHVRGFKSPNIHLNANPPINRDTLQFPTIQLSERHTDFAAVGKELKPIFDSLANTMHLARSESYDADGNFLLKENSF